MAKPELDVARIRKWCATRVPEHVQEQLRVEALVADRHVTIVERRPPWQEGLEWSTFPVARLRFTMKTGLWSLYWRDRNGKFHLYDRREPTVKVQELLDFLDSHEDPIFWG
ncbi:DUF3024 domain-containing protein [Corynebacterium comes]|uniref:DUF3024 domain-containing protein n=1 Tax=Corynebacterium comes TaxID=2675218 RepID=A0A6B8W1N4_9CORY|nr:DUF3024 domain-containing protein [Corynebacterium comes]QGU05315.1 hypothetical protein CETAM_10330 [Corynebacterium comes]